MQISIHLDAPEDEGSSSGPVAVGWFLNVEKGAVIYDAPRRVNSRSATRSHAKAASRCPAALNAESRYFEIKCPFDLNIKFARDAGGTAHLKSLAGQESSIRPTKLKEVIHLVNESEWRYKDRPTVQLILPYVFVSDDPVYVSQVPPIMHYRADPLPGIQFCGRFPINIWPRPLLWAFEWIDVARPLVLVRGEPLFYVLFETSPQERPVQLIEAEVTPELKAYYDSISGVTNYVNQTFSLYKTAHERRPRRLLTAKKLG